MRAFTQLVISVVLLQWVNASPLVSNYLQPRYVSSRNVSSATVMGELGASLSVGTTIYGPNDAEFGNLTHRWGIFAEPKVQVVVEPTSESDVTKIVQYCNKNGFEFLAYSGGHGTPKSLASFNGVQISMNKLTNITIQPDGNSAWIQGGALGGQVNRYLWDRGFVSTTGACACVSVAGAGLGGGHGPLEGFYGMISDNFLQLNVILANGSAIRVNATHHSDLFWAMRGAGHNFGIVTSMEMSIYPRGPLTWHYKNYFWQGDQLEAVFTALNTLHGNGTTPVIMATNVGNFMVSPTISDSEPVIFWQFSVRGTAEEAAPYLAPFDAIPSVSSTSADVPYPEIAPTQFTGESDLACTATLDRVLITAGLQTYNLTAERQIFDSFRKRMVEQPELVSAVLIIHEGYSTEAVIQKDSSSTAYPFRADYHLTQFQGNLPANSSLEEPMIQWARETQDLWNGGQPGRLPNAYVNYASGFEDVQEIYGHEPWRVSRLRDIKAQYDQFNRFRFYNPLI